MLDHQALLEAFRDYASQLLRPYAVGPVLYRLTDQVVAVLGVDGAGVCLGDGDGVLRFVTATDGDVATIEEEQVAHDTGPCLEAFRTGNQVVVADLAASTRFDGYRESALAHGARAVAGIPMPVGEARLGALNLYWRAPHDPSTEELEVAQLLADMASGYILNATERERVETLASQLQHALDSRIVIEQAKGVLVERHHISPAEAFHQIRVQARSSSRRVHDLASEIVQAGTD